MITDTNAAHQISEILLDVIGQLHDSAVLVKESCNDDDFVAYSRAATEVLLKVSERLLAPIAAVHPVTSPQPDKPLRRDPMLANVDVAKRVSEMMFEVSKRLDESLEIARSVAPANEVKIYARGVGEILSDIMYEILNPVFAGNPSIEPKGWK